ncbi:MAG: patatin-like phospholipase family protein [Gemmatimonadaceae bacterium]
MSTALTPAAAAEAAESDSYLPERRRQGIGLCLSGGGFRATLFHLGALRRLNELGVLHRVRTISSVSGGSLMALVLADAIRKLGGSLTRPFPDFDAQVAKPTDDLTASNFRGKLLRRRINPLNILRGREIVDHMATLLEKSTSKLTLPELPAAPNFVFCATDMAFGVNWVFERQRMGDYQVGYQAPPPDDYPAGRAAAASACFPPLFNPLRTKFHERDFKNGKCTDRDLRKKCVAGLRLTDGGNYDNMGLEPVWKRHEIVLVSDGGGPFEFTPDRGLKSRIFRYADIVQNQARALRRRWLIASFSTTDPATSRPVMDGTYWAVSSARSRYIPNDSQGYSKEVARDLIANIRTDLDTFSDGERAVLENHGYFLADVAVRRHVSPLMPVPAPELRPPHPDWLDEKKVRDALKDSNKRKIRL